MLSMTNADKNVIVRRSKISGKGVFAARDFAKGEVVLKWTPLPIAKAAIEELPKKERAFVEKIGKRFYLMQTPERFVNHSCDPNTMTRNKADVALRGIRKGEEITSDYSGQGIDFFRCRCGSEKCRRKIVS
jgi:SET domain-containing protein